MSARDIWPFAPNGDAKGPAVRHFQMGAGTTDSGEDTGFLEGNWMVLDTAVGDINPLVDGADAPGPGDIFVSAASSRALKAISLVRDGNATGIARIMVPCYDVTDGSEFVTRLAYNNNDTELDLDSGFQIGDTFGCWVDDAVTTLVGHNHGIDLNGSGFIVTRKLDAQGRDSIISGAATTQVVFKYAP